MNWCLYFELCIFYRFKRNQNVITQFPDNPCTSPSKQQQQIDPHPNVEPPRRALHLAVGQIVPGRVLDAEARHVDETPQLDEQVAREVLEGPAHARLQAVALDDGARVVALVVERQPEDLEGARVDVVALGAPGAYHLAP